MIFYYIFTIIGIKHLVVEWLSWLPYKSGFINSNILESSRDIHNTPPCLKLLEQRVYELVGGGGGSSTEPPLDNFVGSKRFKSGRVNTFNYCWCFIVKLILSIKVTVY